MMSSETVESLSGEDVRACFQCGLCSGSCPVRFAMELSPTQVMRLVQIGDIEKIFRSNTFWICSTCYTCQTRCPREIKITKVMEALRQIRLRKDNDKIQLGTLQKKELGTLPTIALVGNLRKTTN